MISDVCIVAGKTSYVLHLQTEELGGVLLDEVLVGEGHLLELLGVRSGDLSTGDTDGRSVQVVEGVPFFPTLQSITKPSSSWDTSQKSA